MMTPTIVDELVDNSSSSISTARRERKPRTKRTVLSRKLNFILSEESYQDFQDLANQSHRSMTDLIRYSLGLLRIFLDAKREKNRVVILDSANQVVKEIVLPL